MRRALRLAAQAAVAGEVPVGALIVFENRVIGEGANCPLGSSDPTGHAEIVALRMAGLARSNYRLPNCTLYVTVEPCTMCVGALIHARIASLVFGASEPKAGAVVSRLRLLDQDHFNHRIGWRGGVLADEAGALMANFFRARR